MTGATAGVITSVGPTSLSDSDAGWAQVSTTASPVFVRLTSGPAAGRTFLVVGNSQTQLEISPSDGVSQTPVNLLSLGVAAGDSYELVQGDTVRSILGAGSADGIGAPLGANNPDLADHVQINTNNSWYSLYYDLTQAKWIDRGSEVPADNLVISPDSAILYHRLATSDFELVVTGTVPSQNRKSVVRSGQTTFLASFWPVGSTVSSLGIENLPGWAKHSDPNSADQLVFFTNSQRVTLYHDNVSWKNALNGEEMGSVQIPQGSGVILRKKAVSSNAVVYDDELPYSL